MYNLFNNKVVVVTGSGRGIGKATALLFCKNGSKVMLNGRDEIKIKKTAAEFNLLGYEISFFVGDVTCIETCEALVEFTIKTFGKINILITNAGISMNARFDKMKPEFFKKVLDSNIYGTVMPLFASLEALKQTKGSVIFIGSVAGFYGMPTASAYSAGKMALTAIQQSIKSELNKYGVHIGILYVGFTENENDKKLISSSGEWEPVPKRMRFFQQSQNKVAKSVLLMVKYRLNKRTISLIGISTAFVARFMPWIIKASIYFVEKKSKE